MVVSLACCCGIFVVGGKVITQLAGGSVII